MRRKKRKNKWLGRSLENYKKQHKDTAKTKGVSEEFKAAITLTAARKIVFGGK